MKRPKGEALKAPPIDSVLIEWLTQLFPDKLPDVLTSHAEMCALAGEQRVIRRLQTELKRQTEPVPE